MDSAPALEDLGPRHYTLTTAPAQFDDFGSIEVGVLGTYKDGAALRVVSTPTINLQEQRKRYESESLLYRVFPGMGWAYYKGEPWFMVALTLNPEFDDSELMALAPLPDPPKEEDDMPKKNAPAPTPEETPPAAQSKGKKKGAAGVDKAPPAATPPAAPAASAKGKGKGEGSMPATPAAPAENLDGPGICINPNHRMVVKERKAGRCGPCHNYWLQFGKERTKCGPGNGAKTPPPDIETPAAPGAEAAASPAPAAPPATPSKGKDKAPAAGVDKGRVVPPPAAAISDERQHQIDFIKHLVSQGDLAVAEWLASVKGEIEFAAPGSSVRQEVTHSNGQCPRCKKQVQFVPAEPIVTHLAVAPNGEVDPPSNAYVTATVRLTNNCPDCKKPVVGRTFEVGVPCDLDDVRNHKHVPTVTLESKSRTTHSKGYRYDLVVKVGCDGCGQAYDYDVSDRCTYSEMVP